MRLNRNFYLRDVLSVAPDLLGKYLVRRFDDGRIERKMITEVETYRGEEDLAAHVRFGRTKRNEVMYWRGGFVYVYLIYGMYWLLNVVTGKTNEPQAALIRGVEGINGPGRVGMWLGLDRSFYTEDLTKSSRIWITSALAKTTKRSRIIKTPRIGVDYAGKWAKKPWRYVIKECVRI